MRKVSKVSYYIVLFIAAVILLIPTACAPTPPKVNTTYVVVITGSRWAKYIKVVSITNPTAKPRIVSREALGWEPIKPDVPTGTKQVGTAVLGDYWIDFGPTGLLGYSTTYYTTDKAEWDQYKNQSGCYLITQLGEKKNGFKYDTKETISIQSTNCP